MSYAELLSKFHGLKAVVIGDLMIDEYIHGSVGRISPEAPVMVVRHQRTYRLPGGAANVAKNLMAFGAEVTVVGVVGSDDGGLTDSLRDAGMNPMLVIDPDRVTTRKTRILADERHQLLRVDAEDDTPLASALTQKMLDQARSALMEAQVVLLSDYRKGALTQELVREVQLVADRKGALCAANAKPSTFDWFAGCDFVTLNRSEASAVLGRELPTDHGLDGARELSKSVDPTTVAVTLGSHGMAISGPNLVAVIGAKTVEVSDPAGAGDTVLATAALAAALEGVSPRAFELSALAAAAVVRHVGVATPNPEDLREIGESTPGILIRYASP